MPLIHQILTQNWGHSQFRPLQEDIIRSVLDGRDTLALLPTGGGKSICFQVPALAMPGLCLVISPLIALMRDQEEQLKKKGIRAVAIVSGMTKKEIEIALENCVNGDFKFLYISPERLASESFRRILPLLKLNMIAVDEAHCISQWGYDFRPPYLRIAEVRSMFPEVPILALTASATPEVQQDICEKLQMKNPATFAKSFARPNLSYLVRPAEDKFGHLMKVLKAVPGTSIVYVRNRRKTQEVVMELQRHQITADFYHAGLDQQTRMERQQNWMSGKTRVIVATNAFGMGIDKPDVRTVIHLDLPDNPENYYQEAGRGGRDGKPSYAVILFNNDDIFQLERRAQQSFPERDYIRKVYATLSNYLQIPLEGGQFVSFPFDLSNFCQQYRLEAIPTLQALKILEMAEYINITDPIYLPARVHIICSSMDLYRFQVESPRHDPLIKTLLRSYAGLFDDYVRFSETELARRANISREEVTSHLQFLKERGFIDYIPATDAPRITFAQSRIKEHELRLPASLIEERKERYEKRVEAFVHFLTERNQCRSMMLLTYFGEKNLSRCGTCDYCRERNKVNLNDLEVEGIEDAVRLVLKNGPQTPQYLVDKMQNTPVEKLQAVVRWMLDVGTLQTDALGRLMLMQA